MSQLSTDNGILEYVIGLLQFAQEELGPRDPAIALELEYVLASMRARARCGSEGSEISTENN